MAEVVTSRAFLIFLNPSTHPQQTLRVRFFAYCTKKRASVVGMFLCVQFDQGDKFSIFSSKKSILNGQNKAIS